MSQKISAFILAGGKSSRMGEDKGLILISGKPVISFVLEELRKLTNDITIVTSNEKYKQFGIPLYEDLYKEKGPAAGIDTALQQSINELVFVTGCDMPFINEKAILTLMQNSQHSEITVAGDRHFMEPLFAFYKKPCKDKWRELLLKGTLKLSEYFSHFDTNFVPTDKFLQLHPHLFLNLNTPQDLEMATTWIKK